MYIESNGFSEAYVKLCADLIKYGKKVSPRDMSTQELEGVTLKILNPRTRILSEEIRKISLSFAVGEWLWCLSGKDDLEIIQYYAPSYSKYSDDGMTLNGAYGPRIKRNITKIIDLLKKDMDTRRAVIPIYADRDVGLESNDIPCTLSLQFAIRNNKLDMFTTMRSNDIFLGLPYDVFNFTMWQEYIACMLNINIGTYTHNINSIHFYEKNREKIEKITKVKGIKENVMPEMPKEDIDFQINKLLDIEEKIRKNTIYDVIDQKQYFQFFTTILEKYNKKVNKMGS